MKVHRFPQDAVLFDRPSMKDKPYEVLGRVRTKVNFPSLDGQREDTTLCKNYFNKAAKDLLSRAKKAGGDAVMEFRSVTFMMDGKSELHKTAECADDGEEGQVLAEGYVIKWKPLEDEDGEEAPKTVKK